MVLSNALVPVYRYLPVTPLIDDAGIYHPPAETLRRIGPLNADHDRQHARFNTYRFYPPSPRRTVARIAEPRTYGSDGKLLSPPFTAGRQVDLYV